MHILIVLFMTKGPYISASHLGEFSSLHTCQAAAAATKQAAKVQDTYGNTTFVCAKK